MTQPTHPNRKSFSYFWIRSLLFQSVSCLGVLSLLGSNLVVAQTASQIDSLVAPVEASKLVAETAAKPSHQPQAASHGQVKRALPKLHTNNSLEKSAAKRMTSARIEKLRQKLYLAPAATRQKKSSQVSATEFKPVAESTKVPGLAQIRSSRVRGHATTNAAIDGNGSYIDKSEYSIGATRSYQAPSTLVMSERSTGCKAILKLRTQASNNLCQMNLRQRSRIAIRGVQPINTVRFPRPQTPSWVRKSRSVSVAAISPIRLGPISLSPNGFSATNSNTLSLSRQLGNANRRLLFPLSVPAPITSIFGFRIHPIRGGESFHTGTDLGAPMGTPVIAAENGKVAIANFLGGYGLTVVLEHNKANLQTLYGHLSEVFVQPGEWVEQGTVIGRVGNTGNSTGPHLHFETRYLTPEGWVVADPNAALEFALTRLVTALHPGKTTQQLKVKLAEVKAASSTNTQAPTSLAAITKEITLRLNNNVASDPGSQIEHALSNLVDALRANQPSEKTDT